MTITGSETAFPEAGGQWVSNEDIHHIIYGKEWKEIMKTRHLDEAYPYQKFDFQNRYWTHIPGTEFHSNEATTDVLMEKAARKLLTNKNRKPSEIAMVIAATTTPSLYTPSMATIVSGRLGLRCPAFDIKTGCSSNIYALALAALMIGAGVENVLLLGAETISKAMKPATGELYAIGDGGAAILLSKTADKTKGIKTAFLNADGSFAPFLGVHGKLPPDETSIKQEEYFMRYDRSVEETIHHKWAEIPEMLFQESGMLPGEIDLLITHQVNKKIIAHASATAGISEDKAVNVVGKYGNCGSVSLLIALHEARQNELFTPGDLLLLEAVGGGLAWGGLLFQT